MTNYTNIVKLTTFFHDMFNVFQRHVELDLKYRRHEPYSFRKRFERLYCGKYWCLEPSRWTFWHCYETYQFSSSYLKSHGTQKHYLTYLEYTTCPLYRMKCNHKCWAAIIGWAHMHVCTEWIIKIYHFYKCIILLYWILGRIALILTIQIHKNDLVTIITTFHNNNLV